MYILQTVYVLGPGDNFVDSFFFLNFYVVFFISVAMIKYLNINKEQLQEESLYLVTIPSNSPIISGKSKQEQK